jgi:hypothetical protein
MNSEKFVRQASSERIERRELEEIEEKIEDILETLNRLEKLIQSLLPPPPGKAVSAVLDFIS